MTVKIQESFTGYPDGERPRDFEAGQVVNDLPAEFEALIVQKGHAVMHGESAGDGEKAGRKAGK